MSVWIYIFVLILAGCFSVYDGLTLCRWRRRQGFTWIGSNYKRVLRILFGVILLYIAYGMGECLIVW